MQKSDNSGFFIMEAKMNKNECKKYIKRAFKRIINTRKSITAENFEMEIQNSINKDVDIYVACAKIAIYNLKNSATEITVEQLIKQIDIIPIIYKTENGILQKAKQI